MEKRMRRPAGLTVLFWRYLLTTSAVILALAVLWWLGLNVLMQMKFVYPAGTAAYGVDDLVYNLEAGAITPEEIPYYYRWAIFDRSHKLMDPGNMNRLQLSYAESALAGDSIRHGIFYAQYHRVVELPTGEICVVQYDYSMPYGLESLQNRLPEFQTCAILILLGSWLLTGILLTRHFASLLRRDAALLTAAAQTIARQRLDTPLEGRARVREFGQTLAAMDQLRISLAQSLERQWGMEQQRQLELAALTHDLKTPLTVISGNAELLQEDQLEPAQQEMVDAILRSADRLQSYAAQLRAMTLPDAVPEEKEPISLDALAESWKEMGQSLCTVKRIDFVSGPVPDSEVEVYRASLDRAVVNLLDNAVRYTPAGGQISLSVTAEKDAVAIAVEDTGPGFSAEALAKGGQAFFTSDASRPQEGHLGLGLFFVRQTARKHGGTLELANTGRGARVVLTLPA